MTVKEFINEMKTSKNKEKTLQSAIIKNGYVNYETKISLMRIIAESTTHVESHGIKLFKQDLTSRHMLFVLELINMYTNIDIDFNHVLDNFNQLDSCGLINQLLELIPQDEKNLCSDILDMLVDDIMVNERDILSFAETKIESLNKTLNSVFGGILDDPRIKKKMGELIESIDLQSLIVLLNNMKN